MTRFVLSLAFSFLLPAAVQAQQADATGFDDAWIRAVPPGSPVMAGYVQIHNGGSTEMLVDSASSDAFGAIEIHEMRDVNGVMRMRPLPELRIEPGLRIALAPGGKHLMLFRPQRELAVGERVDIVFALRDGSQRRVSFEVRAPAL